MVSYSYKKISSLIFVFAFFNILQAMKGEGLKPLEEGSETKLPDQTDYDNQKPRFGVRYNTLKPAPVGLEHENNSGNTPSTIKPTALDLNEGQTIAGAGENNVYKNIDVLYQNTILTQTSILDSLKNDSVLSNHSETEPNFGERVQGWWRSVTKYPDLFDKNFMKYDYNAQLVYVNNELIELHKQLIQVLPQKSSAIFNSDASKSYLRAEIYALERLKDKIKPLAEKQRTVPVEVAE